MNRFTESNTIFQSGLSQDGVMYWQVECRTVWLTPDSVPHSCPISFITLWVQTEIKDTMIRPLAAKGNMIRFNESTLITCLSIDSSRSKTKQTLKLRENGYDSVAMIVSLVLLPRCGLIPRKVNDFFCVFFFFFFFHGVY